MCIYIVCVQGMQGVQGILLFILFLSYFILMFIRGDFTRDGLVTRKRCVSMSRRCEKGTDGEWHLPF